MEISELAKRTGVSAHALRRCEKLGLIQPARSNSGYRDNTETLRRKVVFTAMSRQIGFSLNAIAAQLPAYRSGRLTADRWWAGRERAWPTLTRRSPACGPSAASWCRISHG